MRMCWQLLLLILQLQGVCIVGALCWGTSKQLVVKGLAALSCYTVELC
jgi:hypothetical protein